MRYVVLMTGCCCYTGHGHGHWGERGLRTRLECKRQSRPIHDGVHAPKPGEAENDRSRWVELSDKEVKRLSRLIQKLYRDRDRSMNES